MADWQGRLLVATPLLTEDTFARTVVQLLAYDADDGAFGVVLTRPTGTPMIDVLPGWAFLAPEPSVVFNGGPVQESTAVCLARVRDSTSPQGFVTVPGAREVMRRRVKRDSNWLYVLKRCPVPMDDLPPRSREVPKKRKLCTTSSRACRA